MPLREILLTGVVLFLCIGALLRPRLGVYGYVWYAAMRPDVLAWCEDQHSYSMMLAVCTLIGALPHLGRLGRLFDSWIVKVFLVLQFFLLLSTVLAVNPSLSTDRYLDFVRSLLVLLLVPVLFEEVEQLKRLFVLIGLSVGLIGFKLGSYAVLHGGVMLTGGYGGQMSDNNAVGLALTIIVPLCWYGRQMVDNRWIRALLLCVAASSVAAIVMTNSRGSQLALAAVFICLMVRAKRKLGVALLLVLIAGAAIYQVRDQYVARMQTISNYEQDESATSRIEYAKVAVKMWSDYPLFGVGFGGLNYVALLPKYLGRDEIHVAHNTYLQMLVDSGIFAFAAYLSLLLGAVWWLGRRSRAIAVSSPELSAMGLGVQTALIAFVVGGTFYSFQRYDLPYFLLLFCAGWDRLGRELPEAEDSGDEESALIDAGEPTPAV